MRFFPTSELVNALESEKTCGKQGHIAHRLAYADLVILDRNPLKVEPMAIKDIKVVETIKEGKTIYTRQL